MPAWCHAIRTALVLTMPLVAACASPEASSDASPPSDLLADGEAVETVEAATETYAPSYACNQLMGVSVLGEWFSAGFEAFVDDARWQAISKLHAYVDLWADPAATVWDTELTSPCADGSTDPERVLFLACDWTYTTAAEWNAALTAVVENLKARYPALEHVEILTMLRAPGNQPCGAAGSPETVVQPVVDEAVATVVAAYAGFVSAAPPFEAPDCDVFLLGGPHLLPDGKAAIAKLYGEYYATH